MVVARCESNSTVANYVVSVKNLKFLSIEKCNNIARLAIRADAAPAWRRPAALPNALK
jgi:hypothetical protein